MSDFFLIVFWITAGIIFYVLVGYPALLLLLSRFVKHRAKRSTDYSVTLIVPAHNEENVLEAKLTNSLALDYPADKLEILVASDGSVDRTVEIGRSFESRGVRVLAFQERRGKASAVNDAVREARGDVLFLCDANVMFRPDALQYLVGRLDESGVGAVTGVVQLASEESNFGRGETFYYRIERAIQLAESQVGSLMGVDGGMYIVRKELFKPLPPDSLLDDFATSMEVVKQGKKIVYEPLAKADENGTPTAMQEYRRRVRMAAGAVQVIQRRHFPQIYRPIQFWQFLSHKLFRWLEPFLLVLLFVSNVALWSSGVFYQVTLIAQLVFYAMAGLAAISLPFRNTTIGAVPFYFVLGHIAIIVGIFRGLLKLQKVTWAQAERTAQPGSEEATPQEELAGKQG